MGQDAVEQRLQDALEVPAGHALAAAVDAALARGAPALVAELPPARSPTAAAALAATYAAAGVDAIVVTAPAVAAAAAAGAAPPAPRDDDADAAAAAACLLAAVRAAPTVPVLLRDWIVHPLQLADLKAAGAAGALGAAAAVLGRGAPTLTGFGAAMGLDVPLEVVNAGEAEGAADAGVPLVAVNVSLALSLGAIPGAGDAVASGVVAALPPGMAALVGVDSAAGAAGAARAGAAAVVVKAAWWAAASDRGLAVGDAVAEMRDALSLDD
jgi:indole-3-glycerol phosphate synthase